MPFFRQWLFLDSLSSAIIAVTFLYVGSLERLTSLTVSGVYFAVWALFAATSFIISIRRQQNSSSNHYTGRITHIVTLIGGMIIFVSLLSRSYSFIELRVLLVELVRAPPYLNFSFSGSALVVIFATFKLFVSRLFYHLKESDQAGRFTRSTDIDLLPLSISIAAVLTYRYWGVVIIDLLLAVILIFALEIVYFLTQQSSLR